MNQKILEHMKESKVTTWVIVTSGKKVSVYNKSPGCKISPLKPNCQCGVDHMNPEHIDEYLDAALVTGKFSKLVLVGSAKHIRELRDNLDEMLLSRIDVEIITDKLSASSIDKKLEQLLEA